jgi:hypothetical protein
LTSLQGVGNDNDDWEKGPVHAQLDVGARLAFRGNLWHPKYPCISQNATFCMSLGTLH